MPVLLKYALGLMDNNLAKEKLLAVFFAHEGKREFTVKARWFSQHVLPALVRTETMQKLQWHREQGHRCILVSASLEDYLLPWAEQAGFSKALATRLEVNREGLITGKLSGKNCYGPEKARRLEEDCGPLSQFEIYAYGDSRGDKELLEMADHPFYRSLWSEREFPRE
jgi:HAD superfamily hydrolase (TIGR01490 family)